MNRIRTQAFVAASRPLRPSLAQRWRQLLLAVVIGLFCVGVGARTARATGGERVGDALDDQAYLDQLNLTLADAQANLASVQYYLPLGSLTDPNDPTWQIVTDAAQALASDAGAIGALSPPDRFAATQTALSQSIQSASENAGSAVDAFLSGDTRSGEQALIGLNDQTAALLRARMVLPGAMPRPSSAQAPLAPPASSFTTGDGSSALAPVAAGTPLAIAAGWQVQVLGVDFDAWPAIRQADALNSPPATGSRMVLVHLAVSNMSNNGEAADRLRYSDFAVQGAADETYLPFATNFTCGDVPTALDVTLPPGGSAVGDVCVQLPASESDLELVSNYHLESSDARYFALQ